MKHEIYRLIPEFKERIWGGSRLVETFGFETDVYPLGEAWNITSLVGNADNTIENTEYTLDGLYQNHRELFGTKDSLVPVKGMIIDSQKPLSVQVHPNDKYALEHDNSRGKPEAWYIIDAKEGATIEFGHAARNKEELRELVEAGKWDQLLRYVNPKQGDFLYVADGVMHALGEGMLTYEVSKNADLTYRVYDYDRVDVKTGKKRELHLQKSLDVLKAPVCEQGLIHPQPKQYENYQVTTYCDKPMIFTFRRLETINKASYQEQSFWFFFVVNGEGTVDNHTVKKGDTWFVPLGHGPVTINGNFDMLVTTYREQ